MGTIAAAAGTVVGLAAWIVVAPELETLASHRIDRFAIPWSLLALGMVLAVAPTEPCMPADHPVAISTSRTPPPKMVARTPPTMFIQTVRRHPIAICHGT